MIFFSFSTNFLFLYLLNLIFFSLLFLSFAFFYIVVCFLFSPLVVFFLAPLELYRFFWMFLCLPAHHTLISVSLNFNYHQKINGYFSNYRLYSVFHLFLSTCCLLQERFFHFFISLYIGKKQKFCQGKCDWDFFTEFFSYNQSHGSQIPLLFQPFFPYTFNNFFQSPANSFCLLLDTYSFSAHVLILGKILVMIEN